MKFLVILLLVFVGWLVLRFVAWGKDQNTRWLQGQPSYHDRFSWLGDLIRRITGR